MIYGRATEPKCGKATTAGNDRVILPLILAVYAGPEERALIARLQRRDPQALAELYDRYGRAVYSLVLRVVRR